MTLKFSSFMIQITNSIVEASAASLQNVSPQNLDVSRMIRMHKILALLAVVAAFIPACGQADDAQSLAVRRVELLRDTARLEGEKKWLSDRLSIVERDLERAQGKSENDPGILSRLKEPKPDKRKGSLEQLFKGNKLLYNRTRTYKAELEKACQEKTQQIESEETEILQGHEKLEVTAASKTKWGISLGVVHRHTWPIWGCLTAGVIWMSFHHWKHHRHRLRKDRWVRNAHNYWPYYLPVLTLALLTTAIAQNWLFQNAVRHLNPDGILYSQTYIQTYILPNEAKKQSLEIEVQTLEQQKEKVEAEFMAWLPVNLKGSPEAINFMKQISIEDSASQTLAGLLELDLQATELIKKPIDDVDTALGSADVVTAMLQLKPQTVPVSIGSLVVLIVLYFAMGGFMSRSRNTRDENTCPRCLNGRLIKSEVPDHLGLFPFVCDNQNITEGIACNFRIHDTVRKLKRFCFPTLGVGQAGKTHWLSMFCHGIFQGHGDVEELKDAGILPREVPKELLEWAEDFMDGGDQGTSATNVGTFPLPVLFEVSDADRICMGLVDTSSDLLVTMMDYAGLVTTEDDPLRKRALDAEGYLFFIDPTKDISRQASAIQRFARDVRVMGEHAIGGQERIKKVFAPVAICITKLDLLPLMKDSLDDAEPVFQFLEELMNVDADYNHKLCLGAIQARHKITQQWIKENLQNWHIESLIQKIFGDRYCFFPMSPVGLKDARSLFDRANLLLPRADRVDFAARSFEKREKIPFHLAEPFHWLIHMNGHRMFP